LFTRLPPTVLPRNGSELLFKINPRPDAHDKKAYSQANQDQMGLLSKEEEKEKMTRVHNEMGAVTLQNLLQAHE
jgi:hypothetical protein